MSKSLKLYGGTAVGIAVVLLGAVNFADRNVADFPDNPRTLGALPQAEAPEQVVAASASAGGIIGAAEAATSDGGKFGIGREALPEEVAAWNIDVSPDGTGLPVGEGDVGTGEMVFEENCAVCHGSFAEGVDNWPKLAGGDGTLADEDPLKTVGSYWPYLSTVFDYVHRSMPFGAAQTMSPDDVYAIVAYILYSNDLVDDDFVLNQDNFADFEMPNKDGFIVDDRAETEYTQWRTEPCMENCKDEVKITMKATVLNVTPDQEHGEGDMVEEAAAENMGDAAAAAEAAVGEQEAEVEEVAEVAEAAEEVAAIDPELAAAGEKVFKKCKACHQVGDSAKNRTGPVLNGVVGREIAAVEDFRYSKAMEEHGGVWDSETLHAYLADPRGYIPKNKMSFAGLKKPEDVDAVIEYLKQFN